MEPNDISDPDGLADADAFAYFQPDLDQIAYAETYISALGRLRDWFASHDSGARVMVAGPRESKWPGCEKRVEDFLFDVLDCHPAV